MQQGILKKNDINPDGIRVIIRWEKFIVGSSVFIPCVNTELARKQIQNIVKNLNITINTHIIVCDSKLGIGIWRTV